MRRIASLLGVLLASAPAGADVCPMGAAEDGWHGGPGSARSHGCEAGTGH